MLECGLSISAEKLLVGGVSFEADRQELERPDHGGRVLEASSNSPLPGVAIQVGAAPGVTGGLHCSSGRSTAMAS